MTEDEAKTKWCVKGLTPSKAEHCIGADCMAWRWDRVANPAWKPEASQMAVWPPPNPYSNPNPSSILSATDGRCGLAGQQ